MSDTANAIFSFVAFWGLWLGLALLVAALAGMVRLGRGHRRGLPPGWAGRAGMLALLLVAGASGFFLYAVTGPLDSLLDGVRRFHHVLGEEVPDLELRRVADDTELHLHELRGDVTLVNLWATWCPPCVHELPELDRLQETYRERGLTVVTLSQEERQKLLDFAAENAYGMTNVYAADVGWLDVGPSRPISVVLDRRGALREFTVGARDYAGFESMVRPYLDAEPSL
jgi:thiol-disulfide isomerase/thioredoxin